jgi:hypothetical protein
MIAQDVSHTFVREAHTTYSPRISAKLSNVLPTCGQRVESNAHRQCDSYHCLVAAPHADTHTSARRGLHDCRPHATAVEADRLAEREALICEHEACSSSAAHVLTLTIGICAHINAPGVAELCQGAKNMPRTSPCNGSPVQACELNV